MPGSRSRSTRSRTGSLPRERCRSSAFSPPPAATCAERSRSSSTSALMRSRRRVKSSEPRSACVISTATERNLAPASDRDAFGTASSPTRAFFRNRVVTGGRQAAGPGGLVPGGHVAGARSESAARLRVVRIGRAGSCALRPVRPRRARAAGRARAGRALRRLAEHRGRPARRARLDARGSLRHARARGRGGGRALVAARLVGACLRCGQVRGRRVPRLPRRPHAARPRRATSRRRWSWMHAAGSCAARPSRS